MFSPIGKLFECISLYRITLQIPKRKWPIIKVTVIKIVNLDHTYIAYKKRMLQDETEKKK